MKRIFALILVVISTLVMVPTRADAAAAGGAGRALRRMSVRGMWGKETLAPKASTYDDATSFRQEFRVTPGFKEAFREVMADIWFDEVAMRAQYDASLDYDPHRHGAEWVAEELEAISNDLSPLADEYVGDDAPHAMVKIARRILPLFQKTFNEKYRAFYLTKDNRPVTHDAVGHEYEAPTILDSSIRNITTGMNEPICVHRWSLDVALPSAEVALFGFIDLRFQRCDDGSAGNIFFNQEDSNILTGELGMYMHTCITNAACLIKIIALCTHENVMNIPLCDQVVAAWKMIEGEMVAKITEDRTKDFLRKYGHNFIEAVDYHLGQHDPLCDVDHLTERISHIDGEALIPLDNFFRFGALVGEAVTRNTDLSGFPLLHKLGQSIAKVGDDDRDDSEYDAKNRWEQFADIMRSILYPCEGGFLVMYGENIIAKIEAGFMAAFSFQKTHPTESYIARYVRARDRGARGAVPAAVRRVPSVYGSPLSSAGTMHSGESTIKRGKRLRRSRSRMSHASSIASPSAGGAVVQLPGATTAVNTADASHGAPATLLADYDKTPALPPRRGHHHGGAAAAAVAAGVAYRVSTPDAHHTRTSAVAGAASGRASGVRVGELLPALPAGGSTPSSRALGVPNPAVPAVGTPTHRAGHSGNAITSTSEAATGLAPTPALVGTPRRTFLGIPWCCS